MFDVNADKGLKLVEIADGLGVADIQAVTGCTFEVRGVVFNYMYTAGIHISLPRRYRQI